MLDKFPDEFKGAEVWSEVIGYTRSNNPKVRFYKIDGTFWSGDQKIMDVTPILGFRSRWNRYYLGGGRIATLNGYIIVSTRHNASCAKDVIDDINELFPDAKLTHKEI